MVAKKKDEFFDREAAKAAVSGLKQLGREIVGHLDWHNSPFAVAFFQVAYPGVKKAEERLAAIRLEEATAIGEVKDRFTSRLEHADAKTRVPGRAESFSYAKQAAPFLSVWLIEQHAQGKQPLSRNGVQLMRSFTEAWMGGWRPPVKS